MSRKHKKTQRASQPQRNRDYRGQHSRFINALVAAIPECMHCSQTLPTPDDKHVVFMLNNQDCPWVFCHPCWKLLEPHHDVEWIMHFLEECSHPTASASSVRGGNEQGTLPTNGYDR